MRPRRVRLGYQPALVRKCQNPGRFNEAEARPPRIPPEIGRADCPRLDASMRPRRVRLGYSAGGTTAATIVLTASMRPRRVRLGYSLRLNVPHNASTMLQ